MKTKILFSYLMFLFFCFMGNINLYSQGTSKGILIGRITGSEDKKALAFAVVMVAGTNKGGTADLEGKYIIQNIEAGKQTITVSYVGYQTKNVEVVIKPDKTTELNVVLEISVVKGNEVIVTAQRVGQQGSINQQINSNVIENVVAADRLQLNPDANAAESIGRLPGISLNRTGGEGTGIVIRGLDPKYAKILIDGIELPSTSTNNRTTDISGISLNVLQGVEVFKTITPDMNGDATAGAVNVKIGNVPEGLNYNMQAQGGYNSLNKYWKNYKFQLNVSNRFFDNKLGILLNISSENVNRSAQTMASSYGTLTAPSAANQFQPLYVNTITLDDQYRLNKRNSGTLDFDFKVTPNSEITFSNFFSDFSVDEDSVSKVYDFNTGNINYNFNQSSGSKSELFLSSLKSETKFDLFNLNAGISYAQTHNYVPNNKGWTFAYPNGIPSAYLDTASRHLPLETLVNSVGDYVRGNILSSIDMTHLSSVSEDNIERQIVPYFDVKIPVEISNYINGNIKFGAKYENKYKSRYYSYYAPDYFAARFGDYALKYLPWINSSAGAITANGFSDHSVGGFLNNRFTFGWYPNFDRLNQFLDFYSSTSIYYLSHPELPSPFPEARTFFRQDATIMQQTNYRFNENYLGLYIMSDINISDLITFSPGFRYEKVFDNIWGWYTIQLYESSKANGHATIATHSDEYFLPNMRLKIKPTEWMNIFLAYTNTLNRPDYYSLVPINYINTNGSPETLNMGNPELKPEFWSNYDLQVSIFGNEIGYLGISGFYKKVKNMIWTPTIIRSPGDPLIPGFEDVFGPNARVNITEPVNNNYDVLIKGLEFEWQTNFWYLPKPFSYLTLDINYTLMNSATRYPRTQTINTIVGTDNRGRPIYKLITTYYADEASMINQPNNIANCSLGFNYMDLNVWLSYSFTGKKLLSESQLIEENVYALNYSRYDLQVTQGLPLKGLELLFNFANFNNPTENSIQSGDIRPTYLENYGWTVDFGLRYKL